ncbi:hypothetical protein GCM10010104_27480 [Streptomyces indiaensis]|uniref:Carbonic anhydrase n=1 Tax=Streptomyces indiaensis TaxID=284033 RepID=A0ABN3DIB1_9ACTN
MRNTVDLLLNRSRVLAEKVGAGRAAVVGLRYRLIDGSAQLVTARGLDTSAPSRPDRAAEAARPPGVVAGDACRANATAAERRAVVRSDPVSEEDCRCAA